MTSRPIFNASPTPVAAIRPDDPAARRDTDRPARSGTADIMRTLAMLLVVAGHSDWLAKTHPEAHRFIYLFHMPVFFFVSGCVFKSKSLGALISNRAERLLVPYVSVGVLATLYYIKTQRPFAVDNPWLGLAWGTGHSIPWTPLWFLPALFLITAGHGALATIQTKWKLGPWFLAAALPVLLLLQFGVIAVQDAFPLQDNFGRPLGWLWGLDLLPAGMAFFAMGALFSAPPIESKTASLSTPLNLAAFTASLALLAILFQAGASLDFNYRRLQPFFGAISASTAGILMVLFASRVLARSARLSAWAHAFSGHIMVIFLFHSPIQAALLRALPQGRFSSAVVAYAAAIAVPVLMHSLFVKRWPVANFLLGGGRQPARLSPA